MGEPLDNAAAVQQALELLTHPFGFRLAKQHICVSTVGPSVDHIQQMQQMPARKVGRRKEWSGSHVGFPSRKRSMETR